MVSCFHFVTRSALEIAASPEAKSESNYPRHSRGRYVRYTHKVSTSVLTEASDVLEWSKFYSNTSKNYTCATVDENATSDGLPAIEYGQDSRDGAERRDTRDKERSAMAIRKGRFGRMPQGMRNERKAEDSSQEPSVLSDCHQVHHPPLFSQKRDHGIWQRSMV